jgi:hypothetical protein
VVAEGGAPDIGEGALDGLQPALVDQQKQNGGVGNGGRKDLNMIRQDIQRSAATFDLKS